LHYNHLFKGCYTDEVIAAVKDADFCCIVESDALDQDQFQSIAPKKLIWAAVSLLRYCEVLMKMSSSNNRILLSNNDFNLNIAMKGKIIYVGKNRDIKTNSGKGGKHRASTSIHEATYQ
jgi:hypothetical protein